MGTLGLSMFGILLLVNCISMGRCGVMLVVRWTVSLAEVVAMTVQLWLSAVSGSIVPSAWLSLVRWLCLACNSLVMVRLSVCCTVLIRRCWSVIVWLGA